MTNTVDPADKERVDQLIAQQDDVIGQLEALEAEILAAVEELASQRKSSEQDAEQDSEQASRETADSSHQPAVLPMESVAPVAPMIPVASGIPSGVVADQPSKAA